MFVVDSRKTQEEGKRFHCHGIPNILIEKFGKMIARVSRTSVSCLRIKTPCSKQGGKGEQLDCTLSFSSSLVLKVCPETNRISLT